jgi:uncharacterized protein YkwD
MSCARSGVGGGAARAAGSAAGCEALESRVLLSVGPSAREQQMLELLNRLRMHPKEELPLLLASKDPDVQNALAFFKTDRNALAKQWASLSAVAPLAWNGVLSNAALAHSNKMLAANKQSHQLPGEPALLDRLKAAGYANPSFIGENVFAFMESVEHAHAGFAIDWGNGPGGIQNPPGHRENLMSGAFGEVGLSIIDSTPGKSVGPHVVTQEFGARRGQQAYLLGVVFDDRNKDKFYTPGEGVGGATVIASGKAGVFTQTTMTAGGYQMQLPTGTYTVTVSGGGLKGISTVANVTIGPNNVKRDFVKSGFAADAAGPGAALTGTGTLTAGGGAQQTFCVTWSDNAAVNTNSIGTGDVIVTGPGGFSQVAQLVSVDKPHVAPTRTAAYRFTAPGGFFDSAENGTYTVSVAPNQVADTNGNFAPARTIGTFAVNVPPAVITPAGILVVNGTSGNDVIDLSLSGDSLVAKVNGEAFNFKHASVKRIYVSAMAGNDLVTFDKNIIGATIDGGPGNDTLGGTSAGDTMNGADGNDLVLGRGGDDVLAGGPGADTVNGGDGNDRAKRDADDVFSFVEITVA